MLVAGRRRYSALVNGRVVDGNLVECSWEHTTRELVERAIVAVALHPTAESKTLEAVGNGAQLLLRADGADVFEGRIEDIAFAEQRPVTLQLTAYSASFELGANEDDVDFPEGHTPQDVTAYFKDAFGLDFTRVDWPSVPLRRQPYRKKTLGFMVEDVNRKLRLLGHGDFYLRANGRTHEIVAPGGNDRVYVFDAGNAVSMSDRQSTKDLVTRVKVAGVLFGSGSVPVGMPAKTIDNPSAPPGTWGVRQRIIYEKDAGSDADQRAVADATFDAQGTPQRVKVIEAPDVPEIRKGDAVVVEVGTGGGRQIATGVHHDGVRQVIRIEIDTTGLGRRRVVTEKPGLSFPELPAGAPIVRTEG